MIDVDSQRSYTLIDVCRDAQQINVHLAISNPCFEFWLCLHIAEASDVVTHATNCHTLEKRLRELLGSYNKARIESGRFRPHIEPAIQRARAFHINLEEQWPSSSGTHVYKLVERLIQSGIRAG